MAGTVNNPSAGTNPFRNRQAIGSNKGRSIIGRTRQPRPGSGRWGEAKSAHNSRILAGVGMLGRNLQLDDHGRIEANVTQSSNVLRRAITFAINGAGAPVVAGSSTTRFVSSPYDGRIVRWVIEADQVGELVVQVWMTSWENAPPEATDEVSTVEKPTLDSEQFARSDTLRGWRTGVHRGDQFGFEVESARTITWFVLKLEIEVEQG